MPEFYVVYPCEGERCLGIVSAPDIPDRLRFASVEQFLQAMDALGNEWSLTAEIQDPTEPEPTDEWLKQMANAGELKREPKAPRDFLIQGIPPAM